MNSQKCALVITPVLQFTLQQCAWPYANGKLLQQCHF